MFSRSIRIILVSVLIFVVAANFVFFSLSQDTFGQNAKWQSFFVYAHNNNGEYEYRGIKYFMDYLSTFPGLQNSHNTIANIAGVLSMEIQYTGWGPLDYFLGILMILGSPVQLLICFVLDLVNNLIWLFSFFLPHVFG